MRKTAAVSDSVLDLLAALRAIHFLHWTSHWQAKGDPSYGDHLLFQRLYEEVAGEIDGLAEKAVALGGNSAVSPTAAVGRMAEYVQTWGASVECGADCALRAEQDLQAIVRGTYEGLKESGDLSLGMDDFLMSLANDHETHLYLLQQRLG